MTSPKKLIVDGVECVLVHPSAATEYLLQQETKSHAPCTLCPAYSGRYAKIVGIEAARKRIDVCGETPCGEHVVVPVHIAAHMRLTMPDVRFVIDRGIPS